MKRYINPKINIEKIELEDIMTSSTELFSKSTADFSKVGEIGFKNEWEESFESLEGQY